MNWIFLLLAGLFEVSLAFCLGKTKTSVGTEFYCWGAGFLMSTVLSMYLLAKAVQTLPIGTAYAIWTGIGAVGTVIMGIVFFQRTRYSDTTILHLHVDCIYNRSEACNKLKHLSYNPAFRQTINVMAYKCRSKKWVT